MEHAEVTVRVADTGVGIPSDLVAEVFDPYEQAHRGRGGSGVGLTVVRSLVEAHGGRVWVESEEGRGSCFTFTLPVRAPAVRERARVTAWRLLPLLVCPPACACAGPRAAPVVAPPPDDPERARPARRD